MYNKPTQNENNWIKIVVKCHTIKTQLNKISNQIEVKYNHFCNFSNENAGNVIESTPNFELELEMYLKILKDLIEPV